MKGLIALALALGTPGAAGEASAQLAAASVAEVACEGSANDAARVQAAIDALPSSGGTLLLRPGTCRLGETGLRVPAGKHGVVLIGAGKRAVTLVYAGSGAALAVGGVGAPTYDPMLQNLSIDVSGASASAVAVHATRTLWLTLRNVHLATLQGRPSPTGQTALKLDGTGGFSAYTLWDNSSIAGDFAKGIHLTGGGALAGHNAGTFLGGSVAQTSSGTPEGTIGLHIENGGTNTVLRTDFTGWHRGAVVAANSNWIAARFEGNTLDWHVTAAAASTSFWGASFAKFADEGVNTVLMGAGNGAVNAALLTDLTVRKSLTVASGGSLLPVDPGGQKLGDSAHRWRVFHEAMPSASLPQGDPSMDGALIIEEAGAGARHLVIYAGGRRFRVQSGPPF